MVPERYFSECEMVPPKGTAKNKDDLLDDLSEAYILSAEKVAECNILRTEGLELQRKIVERLSNK